MGENSKWVKTPIEQFGGLGVNALSTTTFFFNLFYWRVKSLLLGMICVFRHQDLQISVTFTHFKLWIAVARHNLKWGEIYLI